MGSRSGAAGHVHAGFRRARLGAGEIAVSIPQPPAGSHVCRAPPCSAPRFARGHHFSQGSRGHQCSPATTPMPCSGRTNSPATGLLRRRIHNLCRLSNDFLAANPFSADVSKYGSRACRTANTTTALPRRERVHLQDERPFFLTPFRRTRPGKIRRRRIEPPTAHPWDAGAPARLAMNIWSGWRKPPSTI